MITKILPMTRGWLSTAWTLAGTHKRWIIAGSSILTVVFTSCVTVDQHVMMKPPRIAGAEFVGMSECADCHSEMVERFEWASHSKLIAEGDSSIHMGCEACHGPGSTHSETGGEFGTIVNPGSNPETCYQCHMDVRGSFALPYGHSVENGSVSCNDCHDPHEGNAITGGGVNMKTASDTCTECHVAQRNHYVFRHEATQDGCTVCHSPHGSVNDKMLKAANATLCLQCHFQQQTASGELLIGGRDHTRFLPRGTCWSAGCHEAVHGSNISSSLRY